MFRGSGYPAVLRSFFVGALMVQLVVLVSNRCGVLARVTSVISCVGANIVRCHVTEVPESAMSLLTFSMQADEPQTRAILRKLSRLVEVTELVCDSVDAGHLCSLSARSAMESAEIRTHSAA